MDLTPEQQARLDILSAEETSTTKFSWDDTFQRKLLGMLLTDRAMLTQSLDKIQPGYFSNEAHVAIAKIVFEHFKKHRAIPEKWVIKQELTERLKERDKAIQIFFFGELESLYSYYVPGLDTREYLLDKVVYFAKVQAVKIAFHKCVEKMTEAPEEDKTWSFVYEQMRQAMVIERTQAKGLEYFNGGIDEMFRRMKEKMEGKDRFTTAFESIDNALTGGGLFPGEIGAWIALPGSGKTWDARTNVIMFDGTIKSVKDIVVGDLVMGDDSKPRKVLATHTLWDRSYEIRPMKGESYFVNSKHILSLKNSHRIPANSNHSKATSRNKNLPFYDHPSRMGETNIFNISVEDWFKQSNHFKQKMKGWRVPVEFPAKEVKIDPYILGVWLGDGTAANCQFTNTDNAVVEALISESSKRNMALLNTKTFHYSITSRPSNSIKNNSLYDDLKSYNLINNKHVPHDYKVNSREVRLQILAGLIDTDGSLSKGSCYDIIQKRENLANDICFLARSLGLAAYKKQCKKKCQTGVEGTYYRVSISGDCSMIPVRIKYKKATPRKQVKDVLMVGIDVIDTGRYDRFYGFEVDGNHLFVAGDFTVMHNSLCMVKAAVANVLLGHKVLYLTMEMDEVGVGQRFTSQLFKYDVNNLLGMESEIKKAADDFKNENPTDPNKLIITQFPGGQLDVNGVISYCNTLALRGWKPNLLILDYVGEMKDDPNIQKYESAYRILRDLRSFGIDEQHGTMTAIQPNASAAKLEIGQYIDESNIGTSFDQFKPLDAFWSINQQVIEKDAEVGRGFVIKHRNGRSRFPFYMGFDYSLGTLDVYEVGKDKYREAMNAVQDRKANDVQFDKVGKKSKRGFKPNGVIEPSDEEVRGE